MDLTLEQWKERVETDANAVIVDVRTQTEVDEGQVPNALHMDIYEASLFMDSAKKLDPEKNYYIYCRSGTRSAQACAIFGSLGIKNTYNLLGGYVAWSKDTGV